MFWKKNKFRKEAYFMKANLKNKASENWLCFFVLLPFN